MLSLESADGKGEHKVTALIGQPRDAVWANMLAKMNQAQADLKARLERLEQLVKSQPYLTSATVPIQ